MPRSAQTRIYADFKTGFISEANPLQYPDGAVKDISNFNINSDGTLSVRPGLQLDDSTTSISEFSSFSDISGVATKSIVWRSVGGDTNANVVVVQVGGMLYFFDLQDDGVHTSSPLAAGQIFSNNLDIEMDYAIADGNLFFAHPSRKPGVIKFTGSSFSVTELTIKMRDMELWEGDTEKETGFDSGNTLTAFADYNLRNGGWPDNARVTETADTDSDVFVKDPVEWYYEQVGRYPSISIPFTAGKHGVGTKTWQINAFDPHVLENVANFGNTKPPVGTNIVDAEEWSRYGVKKSGGSDTGHILDEMDWEWYPSKLAFYSQRIWYTGQKGWGRLREDVDDGDTFPLWTIDTLEDSSTIYFSQQLSGETGKAEKCYQENDPTAADINQLLPTDGGTITIKGIGTIYKMIPYGTALIILADNGVWAITGVDRNSFRADSFSVDKISTTHPISKEAVIENEEKIFFLSDEAIHVISPSESTGMPTVQDISSELIKTFYLDIPSGSKKNSKIIFDRNQKTMYMFYSDDAQDLNAFEFFTESLYNKCLLFNMDTGSYYKYDINVGTDAIITSPIVIDKQNIIEDNINIVLNSGDDNVVLGSDNVVLERSYSIENFSGLVLLTFDMSSGSLRAGFSSFTDIDNLTDLDGDYTAYVETGFDSAEDILRASKKAPTIITHTEVTEDGFEEDPDDSDGLIFTNPSSCLLSYGWDWATSYKNQRQVHYFTRNYIPSGAGDSFDYGQDVVTTRTRVRGMGTSLGLRIESEAGKKCNLLGVGVLYTKKDMI